MQEQQHYLCIDLKSFYASVECVERGLDPMKALLVVADPERGDKTICLAVSTAMKNLGVRNRCRVYEIPKNIDYIKATPRMALYIERSADIYEVYLKYFSPEDIHVYSIDEAFVDIGPYLDLYATTPRELAEKVRGDIVKTTGIPAACGLGTNLYLAKVALDISAKHSKDFFGELDEESYKAKLWNYRPLRDFWRIGSRIEKRLAAMGIRTMADLAMADEDKVYREFGIDAEIMIDHAWGVEPVRMEHIKAYRNKSSSLSSGQVLMRDYNFEEAKTLVKEMSNTLALDLVKQGLIAHSVHVAVGYAHSKVLPSSDAGTERLPVASNSREKIIAAALAAYERKVDKSRPIRRLSISLEGLHAEEQEHIQASLFDMNTHNEGEHARQKAINAVKDKFGKNAVLYALDLLPEATQRARNEQIGGHRSGRDE